MKDNRVKITLYCKDCKETETIDVDGVIIIGFKKDQYTIKAHHVTDVEYLVANQAITSLLLENIEDERNEQVLGDKIEHNGLKNQKGI